MTIMDRAQEIREALESAEIRAVTDPRKVITPCALIGPAAAIFHDNCVGQADTSWTIHLLAGAPGNSDALRDLSKMVAGAVQVLPVHNLVAATYDTDDGQAYPAFTLTWEESAQWT